MDQGESLQAAFGSTKVTWWSLSGASCIGLHRACPIANVLCFDDSRQFDILRDRSGVAFHSEEERNRVRIRCHMPEFPRLAQLMAERVARLSRTGPGDFLMVSARSSPTLELLSRQKRLTLVAPNSKLCAWVGNKENFLNALQEMQLPIAKGEWLETHRCDFDRLQRRLGTPFVIQSPVGCSGSGTAIVGSAREFKQAIQRFAGPKQWIAPYLGDLSLNVNCVATATGTVSTFPSVQLVGRARLGVAPGAYCGNDFTVASGLPIEIQNEVFGQAECIGDWLASLGFEGLFGIDFVVDGSTGRAYAVDLNPRWQGSTELQTQCEIREGRVPLAGLEMGYRLGFVAATDMIKRRDDFRRPLRGFQAIVPSLTPSVIEAGTFRPGIYRRAHESYHYQREGIELSELRTEDELLLGGAPPRPGTRVNAGARVGRVMGLGSWEHPSVKRWVDTLSGQLN